MKRTLLTALVAVTLGGAALMAGAPAQAANVTVAVNPGGIAFGYADGYWDRGHQWHQWRNHQEMERWRAANHAHYYAYRHDRDRGHDQGWRDSDHWWQRR